MNTGFRGVFPRYDKDVGIIIKSFESGGKTAFFSSSHGVTADEIQIGEVFGNADDSGFDTADVSEYGSGFEQMVTAADEFFSNGHGQSEDIFISRFASENAIIAIFAPLPTAPRSFIRVTSGAFARRFGAHR